ncbi:MAG: hypothetical protein K2L10_04215 [Ruminococcus sp.]|nr:hypothetical protein [Ruminococcus sp.]
MKIRLIDADEILLNDESEYTKTMLEVDNTVKTIITAVHNNIQTLIQEAPTIDAVPVKHGKWKYKNDEDFDYVPCCSICGEPDALSRNDYNYRGGKIRDNNSNYCPNCGAKMDGVKKISKNEADPKGVNNDD